LVRREYVVRQIATLLKFAKTTTDPKVSAALIEKRPTSKTGVIRCRISVHKRRTLSRLPPGESVRAASVGGLDHFELKRYRSLRRSRSSGATAFAKVPDGAMYVPRIRRST